MRPFDRVIRKIPLWFQNQGHKFNQRDKKVKEGLQKLDKQSTR